MRSNSKQQLCSSRVIIWVQIWAHLTRFKFKIRNFTRKLPRRSKKLRPQEILSCLARVSKPDEPQEVVKCVPANKIIIVNSAPTTTILPLLRVRLVGNRTVQIWREVFASRKQSLIRQIRRPPKVRSAKWIQLAGVGAKIQITQGVNALRVISETHRSYKLAKSWSNSNWH